MPGRSSSTDRSAAIRAGMARARRAGKEIGRNGRVLGARHRVEALERALSMTHIVEEFRLSGISYRSMTERLNRRGEPTPTGSGRWHVKTLQRLLQRLGHGTGPRGAAAASPPAPPQPTDAATARPAEPAAADLPPASPARERSLERARRYRMRAEELRTVADQMKSPETRGTLCRLAGTYDTLADDAESGADGLSGRQVEAG